MKRIFRLLWVILFLATISCGEEESDFGIEKESELEDNGIYDPDDLEDQEDMNDQEEEEEEEEEAEQVGFMSSVVVDLEILDPIECSDALFDNQGCWNSEISSYQDCALKTTFNRGKTGWSGGDATYSTRLPDGRTLWIFADSFIGQVEPDGTRVNNKLVNNTFVLTSGNEFTTMYGGSSNSPQALLIPDDPDDWYWPSDATVYDGELQMTLARMQRIGEGMWGFDYKQFDLAVFSLPDLTLKSLTNKVASKDISYGSCLLEDGDFIYIYGITTENSVKRAHVARAPDGDLTREWEFYDGTGWIDEPSKFSILTNVSNQFAVFKDGGKYYLLNQQGFFGSAIYVYESESPIGPWSERRTVYCTPETGGDTFTYNAFAHPELSENGEIVVSYNINSFDFWALFGDADLYRPKFVKVENWK